jgi:hypothetical protein
MVCIKVEVGAVGDLCGCGGGVSTIAAVRSERSIWLDEEAKREGWMACGCVVIVDGGGIDEDDEGAVEIDVTLLAWS